MKTVLFGLDGATFTVLDALVDAGVMPHLGALQARGARGRLRSSPTPITPQAWTSLATGRGAGRHGVFDFIRRVETPRGVFWRVNDSRDVACETVWDYASRQGKRVTVLNYILNAPPRPVLGHSMPGFVSGRHLRRSTHPPDLFDRLRAVDGLDVKVLGLDDEIEREGLREMASDRWLDWINHHAGRDRAWFQVLDHLMEREPSDLSAIVFDGVDKIQHLAYRYLDPALAPRRPSPWELGVIDACRAYFRQIDDFLGRVVARLGPWGRVFVASDHGFTASTEIFYVNKWLSDQGWLRWRGSVEVDDQGAVFGGRWTDLAAAVDLPATRAFALTPTGYGIHLAVPPLEREAFRAELTRRLLEVRGPDGGRVVTAVRRREDCFPGPFMERAPDLTLTLRDFGLVSVLNAREAVVPRASPVGTHHPDGVLLASGPGIKEGALVAPLDILDVAPLLVHSLGLEAPDDFDGAFPSSLYEPDYLAGDPPRVRRPEGPAAPLDAAGPPPGFGANGEMDAEDEAIVLDRLKSLGYLE